MLLAGFGSGVAALNTTAVLPMGEPFATEQLTRPTIVITSLVPGARDAKETVRLLPLPPHIPPPVESQEMKDRFDESTSVTVTEVAVDGPRLVTIIVFVTSEPV